MSLRVGLGDLSYKDFTQGSHSPNRKKKKKRERKKDRKKKRRRKKEPSKERQACDQATFGKKEKLPLLKESPTGKTLLTKGEQKTFLTKGGQLAT